MKTFLTIYLIIGAVCFVLTMCQVFSICIELEKEGYKIKGSKDNRSLFEKAFSYIKCIILFLIPVLRIIITFVVLYNDEAIEILKEKIIELVEKNK